ncbi:ATP-binding cassette domain-containing protein [Staphylococcus epidermidis]|nr:ATP-binding cassette domain-containing protein [Staphylococcus epidermidis]
MLQGGFGCRVPGGETLAIVGASGSGKSRCCTLLGGLDAPTTGSTLMNQPLNQLSPQKQGALRNHHLGFIYQFHHLLAGFRRGKAAMPLRIRRDAKEDCMERAAEMLRAGPG